MSDCDNDDLGSYFPAVSLYSHYGIAYESGCLEDVATNTCGACGTKDTPCYQEPGSLSYTPDKGGKTTTLGSVVRPAETTLISDGVTMVGGGYFLVAMGCEGDQMHSGGGNFVFLDGHAKRINNNPYRYETQGADGMWYCTYFTYTK